MASTKLRDNRYRNWITGTLSLLYLKEGIEDIIDTEAVRFHGILLQNLGLKAQMACLKGCTQKSMKRNWNKKTWKMSHPCQCCDAWLEQLIDNHKDSPCPSLNVENINPQRWRTGPFEVFKVYMPYGCKEYQKAKDGDINGILSLVSTCRHFNSCSRMGSINLIDKLIKFRNDLFHSNDFLVDDKDLETAMEEIIDFLSGMKSLSTPEQQSVDQAVTKIREMQNGKLDLMLNIEQEILALKEKQRSDLNDLKNAQTTTGADVRALEKKMTELSQKVQALQDSLLKDTSLKQENTRLSNVVEEHSQRILNLETQAQAGSGISVITDDDVPGCVTETNRPINMPTSEIHKMDPLTREPGTSDDSAPSLPTTYASRPPAKRRYLEDRGMIEQSTHDDVESLKKKKLQLEIEELEFKNRKYIKQQKKKKLKLEVEVLELKKRKYNKQLADN